MIKKLKIAYMLYNLFQRSKLVHNLEGYRKYGLKKFYFSSISSKDFKHLSSNFERNCDFNTVEESAVFKTSDEISQQSILDFDKNGFLILKSFISIDEVNHVNEEIDRMLADKTIGFKNKNKIMFAIHKSKLIDKIGLKPELIAFLESIMGEKMKLFQSINFLTGSEQETHSDSIHMTTFPLGGLLGVWIALEDISLENGPLHYFPGSHKLPYYLNSDYDNEGSSLKIGNKDYTQYEKMMQGKIAELNLKKEVFTAKAGDLLVWHANLFHGGEPHLNKALTRKSMVFHFFAENRICYHEITQRPALLRS